MNDWCTWEINGHFLEYNDESHCYICDGLLVPSVTQILKCRFDGKYQNVPYGVLNEAKRKGNLLHETIERCEKNGGIDKYELSTNEQEIADEYRSYCFLKHKYEFTCDGNEMPLLIPYKNQVILAGRMDMLVCDKEGRIGIADIKRTANVDKDYLSYQLTLYSIGLEYSYNVKAEFLRCIWLKNEKRKYVEIPFCQDLARNLLEEVKNGDYRTD